MKFPKKLLVVFILLLTAFTIVACKPEEEEPVDAKPTFSGTSAVAIVLFDEFDPLDGVTATDEEDGDLTADIVVKTNNVNNEEVGNYTVVYEVEDSAGNVATATRSVSVTDRALEDYPLAQYLGGVDLSKLPAEQKDILFAAAERYLLENVYGGVPLYTGASRVIYAERVQLFSPTYNGVMGFGTAFSQFTEDDSNVLMYGSVYGNAGEYTWRASYNTDPTSLNPWNADDSATADFTDLFKGALYNFFFDSTKTSFEILPELAESLPQPVNGEPVNGKMYARKWRITLRDDLEWKFHPDTDVSALPDGYEVLDANDYVWTWRHAMESDWFRARTGGGDFVTKGIKNAAEFLNGTADWEDVGIKLLDDYTIELEYTSDKAAFDVLYGFAGATLTPINQELYEELGEDYGVGPADVASSGVYYLDTWTSGQLLLFKKNELHPDADMYHYTGQQFRYIEDTNQIFAEFEAGRLESASLPSAELVNYANDPRVKVAPDPTTWRLQLNLFGTEEARDAYIENTPGNAIDETYVPEPILMYKEFRQALMYGFDRYEAAVNVVGTYLPAFTLFTSTYFLDGESGLGVRAGEAGSQLVEDFGGSSYGYFPDVALELFKEAVAKGIADGYYDAGTASNYEVIELVLTYASSGNTNAQAMVANIKEQYEDILVDDENFVKVYIDVRDVAFPNNYYDYMMTGATDLGIGGISGSLLNAPGFLDVFSDDNRGGFTLNWGIDTTTPNIPVAYENLDGELVYERWGYNALVTALVQETFVKDGVELGVSTWTSANELIEAILDNEEVVIDTNVDGTAVAEFDLGMTLVDKAEAMGVDTLVARLITTDDGTQILFLISEEDGNYKLYNRYEVSVADSAEALFEAYETETSITTDDTTVYTTISGMTLAEEATAVFADALYAKEIAYTDGTGYIVVVAKIGDNYVVYDEYAYYADAEAAIGGHSGYGALLIEIAGPLTDAEVAANEYLGGNFATVAEIAAALGAPAANTEAYAASWDPSDPWDDVYVLLNFDGRYIGWYWL
jgi:ABC-type oligopeptide transport system substrate-binding subunit